MGFSRCRPSLCFLFLPRSPPGAQGPGFVVRRAGGQGAWYWDAFQARPNSEPLSQAFLRG